MPLYGEGGKTSLTGKFMQKQVLNPAPATDVHCFKSSYMICF